MYEEKKYSINWLKIFLTVIIGFILILLSAKLVSLIFRNRDSKQANKTMENNLEILDEVAKNYFKGDNLPKEVGETKKITVSELIKKDLVDEFKDSKGKVCNSDSSYIEITLLDSEYQIKSYIECEKENDYNNTFLQIENLKDITTKVAETTTKVVETTTKAIETTAPATTTTQVPTTKKVTTTKKTTTTVVQKKTHTVSFNTNGGALIGSIEVDDNGYASLPTPVREGYSFVGWYYHGSVFNVNTPITSDIVLIAKWKIAD